MNLAFLDQVLFKTCILTIIYARLLPHMVQAQTQSTISYDWCSNTENRFEIISNYMYNPNPKMKRSCTWVEDNLDRCEMPEAKLYCPVLCDTCSCLNNNKPFTVPGQDEQKHCRWISKNPSSRCDGSNEVGLVGLQNCPLACGQCKTECQNFSPSYAPTDVETVTFSPSHAPSSDPTDAPTFSAFDTKDKLKEAAMAWCQNPDAWVAGHSDYDKYGPLDRWNISKITDMGIVFDTMFVEPSCEPPVGDWDVSHVTNFEAMFNGLTRFNEDISSWDVGQGRDFAGMFYEASSFDQNISSWDVSAGTRFASMFEEAAAFNQDISGWDVSNGTGFQYMFDGASAFNHDLCGWNINADASTSMFCTKPNCGNCNWYN